VAQPRQQAPARGGEQLHELRECGTHGAERVRCMCAWATFVCVSKLIYRGHKRAKATAAGIAIVVAIAQYQGVGKGGVLSTPSRATQCSHASPS
jgi:hypothetical protein